MGIRAVIFDDIDGSVPAETVSFSLYGTQYELDLSLAHRAQLQEALAPFIAAAQHRDAGTPLALEAAGTSSIEPAVPDHPIAAASIATDPVSDLLDPDEPLDETGAVETVQTVTDGVPDASSRTTDPDQDLVTGESPTATDVRAWAAAHGLGLGSRGPVTSSVLGEYLLAHDLPAHTALAPAASTKPRAKKSAKTPKAATSKGKRGAQTKKDPAPRRAVEVKAGPSANVRQWANRHGLPTSATGPLPKSVTDAFAEAVETTAPKRNKSRVYPAGIREWARENGYTVGNGKISDDVLIAYTAAH